MRRGLIANMCVNKNTCTFGRHTDLSRRRRQGSKKPPDYQRREKGDLDLCACTRQLRFKDWILLPSPAGNMGHCKKDALTPATAVFVHLCRSREDRPRFPYLVRYADELELEVKPSQGPWFLHLPFEPTLDLGPMRPRGKPSAHALS